MTDKKGLALVTGGARGIGFACAKALAAEGWRIAVADLNGEGAAAAAAKIGGGAAAHACDVSDPDQVAALFDAVEAAQGPVAVLVNNAGIAIPGDFLETPLEDFRRVIDVNLIGSFLATQRAARTMVAEGIRGAVVNMSSVAAQMATPTIASYCASKGGIMQLTRAAALALAPHGIRVNAVGPGSIDTDMLAGVVGDPSAMEKVLSRTPLGRIAEPREVADVVAFLASDKASYVTGETIYIDGGRLGLNYTV